MSILNNPVPVNAYNFTEKKIFGSPVTIEVVNETTRDWVLGETVFAKGVAANTGSWLGNVTEQDGIKAGERGTIDVNPSRHISMNQVDVSDMFAVGKNPIFFLPQTNSAAGQWKDTGAVGLVTVNAQVISAAPTATPAYIEYKPPYQDGSLVVA